MAFDIQKNKRLPADGIGEVDSDNNETTLNLVEEASKSNVIATQAWVSKLLKRFCCWTRLFHTDVLHARAEVVTANVKAREAHLDKIYAKSIVLTNEEGGMVRIKVGKDGKIDIEETLCDVFVYPGECLVREYLYRTEDVVKNFAGLTPYQTLLNFVPFVGYKRSEFNGQMCYLLCEADGKDEFINKTLLFTIPPDKVARKVVVLDANGEWVKDYTIPYEDNIRQLTVNLPRFYNTETQEMCQVRLPAPSPIWTGRCTNVFPMPVPPPPPSCTGFVPGPGEEPIPNPIDDMGRDIYDEEIPTAENEIDPDGHYEVRQDEYTGNTYHNIALTRNFFTNNAKTQYLMVELMDRYGAEVDSNNWDVDTTTVDTPTVDTTTEEG